MKKTLTLSKLCFLLIGISFFTRAQTKSTAPVKLPSIPMALTWETPALDYKITNNGITITAGKLTDLYTFIDGNYYSNNVPKLLFPPDSNFIFSAKIKPAFDSIYDGGAILLYSDGENWAKALLEKNDDLSIGLGVSVVKNKKTDDSYHKIEGKEIYVKLAKAGNVFNFYSSKDGKNWALVRTFGYDIGKPFKIGFYTQSPKGNSCKVEYSDIQYKGTGFTNFFTGE